MAEQTAQIPNRELVKRMLALVWHYKWGCMRTLLLQTILLALGISGLGLTGVGVDFLRQTLATRSGHTEAIAPRWPFGLEPPANWNPLLTLGALSVAILLFAALRSAINIYYAISMNKLLQGSIVVDLRARVYSKIQQMSFTFFDENPSGGIINRVTGDVQGVRSFVDGVVLQSFMLILSLLLYLVYMLNIHVRLTLACLATVPLLWILTARFARRVRPAYAEARELFDRQILALSETVQGIHVVKGFVREKEEIAKFETATDRVRNRNRWIFKQISLFQPLIGLTTQCSLVVLLAYGGWLVVMRESGLVSEGVSIGDLLVFAGLLQQFAGQVSNISTIADSMQQSLTSAQRVFEVLDADLTVQSPPDAIRLSQVSGRIEFRNVSFGFRPGTNILKSLSFTLEPGQHVAILGATGAGKSSLLSLVPRFYDVQRGQVLVDGHDVRQCDLGDLRRSIGIVFQDTFLFSNTIRANIAFGHPEATDEQIERAARLASADAFIRDLPDGYDTVLREAGNNLSGGQRQRIAIARALLLDPPILLLDDPTAAVDAETEGEILDAIEQAMAGRTVLIVAHRLSTLRRADRVVVLDSGRIVQEGAHAELVDVDGHYGRIAALQTPDEETFRVLGTGGES